MLRGHRCCENDMARPAARSRQANLETHTPKAIMIFGSTPVAGTAVVEPERFGDERGHFARTYDAREFAAHGLNPAVSQCSTSFNLRAGTLRGMHFQAEPHDEDKLVRCTRGAIFDVALDLVHPHPATFAGTASS